MGFLASVTPILFDLLARIEPALSDEAFKTSIFGSVRFFVFKLVNQCGDVGVAAHYCAIC